MIEINSKNIKRTEELDKASENLPSNLIIQAYVENLKSYIKNQFDMDFLFVPYSTEGVISPNDIVFYNNIVNWIDFDCYVNHHPKLNLTNIAEIALLKMEKIPDKYEYMDLHIQNYHEKIDFMGICCLEFIQETSEKLFSYKFEQKDFFPNISCGTFARVSNGWKFYPKFEPYDDVDTMLQRYNME